MSYTLVRPVLDNRDAFTEHWPTAHYLGDVGDLTHMGGTGDHTPRSSDVIFGQHMHAGWIYAQDLGNGAFDLASFTRWLLNCLRAGKYGEIKYVISRHPANAGVAGGVYFGLFDRRYNWRTQRATGHDSHVHISYMPGYERAPSTVIEDYWRGLHPAPKPDPVFRRWGVAPKLPAYTLGRYSTRTLDRLPYPAWPPVALGYGGPESATQQDFVRALHEYAVRDTKTIMISRDERERAEYGRGTVSWCRLVVEKAGNEWSTDPGRNGRALGASLGAPAGW